MKEMKPLVSVYVVTYNSSKYIIDTLESIKNQTYSNIELIVSDDCSRDNTVELCRDWIDKNSTRFKRVELLTVHQNTGVSANGNRAEAACQGEWAKGIAGDDLLLPNCIADCIEYINENQDTIVLFGKFKPFGDNSENVKKVESWSDYSIFTKTSTEQLRELIFDKNSLPAPSAFINLKYLKSVGIVNDERIPSMEDYPKWINMIRNGIKFHFIDKYLVQYRVGDGLSTGSSSLTYFKSTRLFRFYYQYPIWVEHDFDDAVSTIVREECAVYEELLRIRSSYPYRVGRLILTPVYFFKNMIKKLCKHK